MNQFPKMHVSLYVSDLARTEQFYTTFFGQSPAKVEHRYLKYELTAPALVISFIEYESKVKSNFGHLGFQVETPTILNERLQKMRAANLVHKEEIGTSCCYAVQDKFWVNDPDGHQWEVYFFHKDVQFNDPHYALSSKDLDGQAQKTENTMVSLETVQACC